MAKTGVPLSYVAGEPIAGKRFLISAGARSSLKKLKKIPVTVKNQESTAATVTEVKDIDTPISPTRPKKRKLTLTDQLKELPKELLLQKVCVVSTTSSKLSYVVEKMIKY